MFLQTYDGLLAVDQITLIDPESRTPSGTKFQQIHYRYGLEMRTTRAHPDYVQTILRSPSERE